MAKRKTRLVRMFSEDIDDIQLRFPKIHMADFLHVAVRSNPGLQIEGLFRKPNAKRKKR